jgi:hypothetical protein
MRLCARLELPTLLGIVLLVACSPQQDPQQSNYRLRVANAHLDNSQTQQWLQLGLRHQFSPILIEALHNGVVLPYAWELELMDADGSPWQGRRWLDTGSLNVSYRSFTQWYTLSQQPSKQNKDYPDLERTRQALENISLPVHIPTELMGDDAPYRFRFRIYLDINRLPPPLRLPAQMKSDWRLDSGWHEWWPSSTAVANYQTSQ